MKRRDFSKALGLGILGITLVLMTIMVLSSPAFAWYWSAGASRGEGGTREKIVKDAAGNAIAVWDANAGIMASWYGLGGAWSAGALAIPNGLAFDADMNKDGDYIIAGTVIDLIGGNNRILADRRINGVSTNDEVITANVDLSTEVHLAISKNNDILVVWTHAVGTTHSIKYRLYRSGAWGTEGVLDTLSNPSSNGHMIDVAADDSGNFIAVWCWDDAVEGMKIYGRRFTGGAWSVEEAIGQSETSAREGFPQVTMFGNKEAIVVWEHHFPTYTGIQARRFNGTSWLSSVGVDAGSLAGALSRTPMIASQADGTAMVVFSQGIGSSLKIYANKHSGGVWEGAQEIGCNLLGKNYNVDMDGYGNAAAAFGSSLGFTVVAYQAGLGWLGCSYQGAHYWASSTLTDFEKRVVISPHEILGVWHNQVSPDPIYVYTGKANKDVYADGYAIQTTDAIVDLTITLPYNDICGSSSPYLFQEMRFSNDGIAWSPWEPAPTTSPYTATKTGWDLTNVAFGGNSGCGLKRVHVQYQNVNCQSIITHDEIEYQCPSLPDLIETSVSNPPSSASSGGSFSATDTVKNQGSGSAGSSITSFYLSTDTAKGGGDILLTGSRSVPSLAINETNTGTIVVTIPSSTASGSYYLLACADDTNVVAESNESNNCIASATKVSVTGASPDLTVSAVTAPASAGPGQTITVGATTKNSGTVAAPASTTYFYLSANSSLDTAVDTYLGSRAVPALAAGATNTGTISVTLPGSMATATWYIIAKADGPGAVPEASETNNTYYKSFLVGPDLTVSAMTAPASAGPGQTITVGATTKNSGTVAAPASTTYFYLSANSSLDTAVDTYLGSRAVPALAAGATNTGTISVTLPGSMATATWYIIAKADGPGAVPEASETNNTYYKSFLVGPDLTISAFSAPTSAKRGATISVSYTTKNIGTTATAASNTCFYGSSNTILDAGDLELLCRPVPALAAGGIFSETISATIPVLTPIGTYYLIVKADAKGVISEISETNNTTYRSITINP